MISTRILKTSILGIVAAAIVSAIVAVENPRLLLANAEFFFANTFLDPVSRPQEATGEATPVTQSAAVAQASPPVAVAVAGEAPTGGQIAAAFKTADQSQTETRQPPAENLLGQFQAWAAGKDARADVAPAQPGQDAQPQPVQDVQPQPVQDARANSRRDDQANPVQDAQAQIRPVPKHRPVRHVRNARSEIRPNQNLRAKLRRQQNMFSSGPHRMPEPKISELKISELKSRPCKMPAHLRSWKASVSATSVLASRLCLS